MTFQDIATLVPILILVTLLFHLSNKEIKKSLEQSRETQELLSSKLREARITRLNELAKAAEFGRLAQGLFHDLMTPLTSIILHTEKLEKAHEASRRMAVYIKDIRATLSREDVERECDLREELEGVLHLLAFQAREKKIEIKKEAEPVMWYGSPTKIRQVFSNIISNALDSSATVVLISLYTDTEIVFCVRDNGTGIPEHIREKIFEPFFTTKPRDKGTGIGLATVKSIVEKHLRGAIELESEVGKGTAFTLSFPRGNRDPGASHPHPHRAPDRV